MRDLRLWRRLRGEPCPAIELANDLRTFKDRNWNERLAYLGWLAPLRGHPEPAVRAGLATALAGLPGIQAVNLIIGLLQDGAAEVRHAATEALRLSSEYDVHRWVHALFHPDPEIRRHAVELSQPPSPGRILYLACDPVCQDIVREKMLAEKPPFTVVPLLLRLVRDEALDPRLARQIAMQITWEDWATYPANNSAYSDEWMDRMLAASLQEDAPSVIVSPNNYNRDELDELFALFWEPPPPGEEDFPKAAFDSALRIDPKTRKWITVTLAPQMVVFKSFPHWACRLATALHPLFLIYPWVPLESRRAALPVLLELGDATPKLPPEQVQKLVIPELICDSSGRLDLRALTALALLINENPFDHILKWVPIADIKAVFDIEREDHLAFLTHPASSANSLARVITELLGESSNNLAALAKFVRRAPTEMLPFLTKLNAPDAVGLYAELLKPFAPPYKPLSATKIRRLAEMLAPRVGAGQQQPFLRAWLSYEQAEVEELALAVVLRLAREAVTRTPLLLAARSLPVPLLLRFMQIITTWAGFPYDPEEELANLTASHSDPAVRNWSVARRAAREAAKLARRPIEREPILFKVGYCDELARRPKPSEPEQAVCVGLIGCHDPLVAIDAQLLRFGPADSVGIEALRAACVETWRGERRLPLHGHALLFAFEPHGEEFLRLCKRNWPAERMAGALLQSAQLAYPLLQQAFWDAAEAALSQPGERTFPLAEALLTLLISPVDFRAARLLKYWHLRDPEAAPLAKIRPRVVRKVPSLNPFVRQELAAWIDLRGLPSPSELPAMSSAPASSTVEPPPAPAGLTADPPPAPAESEAKLEPGQLPSVVADARPASDPVADWNNQMKQAADWNNLLTSVVNEGRADLFPLLLEGIRNDVHVGTEQLEQLWLWCDQERENHFFRAAIASSHSHVYCWAVEWLEQRDSRQLLLEFLETGSNRFVEVRKSAVEALRKTPLAPQIWPLLIEYGFDNEDAEIPALHLEALATATLYTDDDTQQQRVLDLAASPGVSLLSQQNVYTQFLHGSSHEEIRKAARSKLRGLRHKAGVYMELAETFAWGVQIARQLSSKSFSVEMISNPDRLGYTRFRENKLYVSPMPILRREPHGREIVEGLILHELGHHLYHRGNQAEEVWKQSEVEKIHPLLNLVSDEHLERNLRHVDAAFGDRLKLLCAYAFQHTTRDIPVEALLRILGGRAFPILTQVHLGASKRPGHVRIDNGVLLGLMERAGLSFSRFLRALRLGQGDRYDDPKVREGLSYFSGKQFRTASMARLLEIARELKRIFGDQTDILQQFDAPSACEGSDDELDQEGPEREALNRTVRRILEGKSSNARGLPAYAINVSAEEDFDRIEKIVQIPYEPSAYHALVAPLTRHAQRLRRKFLSLGLAMQPQVARLTGRQFDRTRALAMITRNDPRILRARKLVRTTDLFLGLVIDCSGSMDGTSMDRAKRFGGLIAEAARGQRGIDLRCFGFTHTHIYDAGHAGACAVAGLEAGGGNNDAAGLWHAAQVARASQRKAKLLVMISDGLPTECTVTALRTLVRKLTTRWGFCCAQVAVQPLEEICFPNYVLLDGENEDDAVAQFGELIARLVGRVLGGS